MGAALCMLSSKSAPSGAHPRPKYLCAGTAPLNHAKGQLLDICPELMLAVLTYLPPAEAHARAVLPLCRVHAQQVCARHHCRRCGAVVCGACSENKACLPKFGIIDAVRVCDRCHLDPDL